MQNPRTFIATLFCCHLAAAVGLAQTVVGPAAASSGPAANPVAAATSAKSPGSPGSPGSPEAAAAVSQPVAPAGLALSPGAPGTPAPAAATPVPLPSASGSYRLQPGDVVAVTVYREPDLSVTARLSEAGEITFPLLGQVKLAGLSADAAQQLIARKLDADYLVGPQVALSVLQHAKQYFMIMGEVARPGIYEVPPEGGLHLLEAIGMAGGFTRIAKFTAVEVRRTEDGKPRVTKVNARALTQGKRQDEFMIYAGDIITVPESLF